MDRRLLVAVIIGLVFVACVAGYYLTLPLPEETTEEEEPVEKEGTYTIGLICDITTMEIGKEYSATIVFNSTGYEGEVWLAPVSYWGLGVDDLYLDFRTVAFQKHNITKGECLSFPATISWKGNLENTTSVNIDVQSGHSRPLFVRNYLTVTVLGQGKPKAFILFLESVDPEKNHVGLTIYDKEGEYIAQELGYRVTSFNKTFIIDPAVPGGPGWGLEVGCEFRIRLIEYQCDLLVRLVNPKGEEVLNTVLSETGAVVRYKITGEDLEEA